MSHISNAVLHCYMILSLNVRLITVSSKQFSDIISLRNGSVGVSTLLYAMMKR